MPDMGGSVELTYEVARELAANPDPQARGELAARQDAPAEILYFLAEDEDAGVRALVAANGRTPIKANLVLADDPSPAVRQALATKVGGQKPPRSVKGAQVAAEVLDRLTRDKVTQVRAIIAEALKELVDADPVLINRLARDAEILVSAPILEYSPVLSDSDLLAIIAGSPVNGALAAISRRAHVDSSVTDAIVASNDSQAITHLLRNNNAHLQENTLDSLIERASGEPTWQEPLVFRPEITERSALKLAEVVAAHLLDRILSRKDLSPEAVRSVAKVVGERLKAQVPKDDIPFAPNGKLRFEPLVEKARALHARGQLDEMSLMVALLTDRTDEVIAALTVRAKQPLATVLEIVATQSPRAVCALAWAAGLSALFATELQVRLAHIPVNIALKQGLGGGYLLRDAEMRWQLEMFGGK